MCAHPSCMFCLSVIKQNNVVEMYVDTDGYHTIGSASPPATMTKGPLYVGGIPGTTSLFFLTFFFSKLRFYICILLIMAYYSPTPFSNVLCTGTFKTVALPIRTPFTGCMQNMYINEKLVAFEKLPKVFGSVNLRACPAGWGWRLCNTPAEPTQQWF